MKDSLKQTLAKIIEIYSDEEIIKKRLIEALLKEDDFFIIVNEITKGRKEVEAVKTEACKELLNELDYRFENAGWQSKDKKKRVYFDPAIDQGKIKDFINNN